MIEGQLGASDAIKLVLQSRGLGGRELVPSAQELVHLKPTSSLLPSNEKQKSHRMVVVEQSLKEQS